MSAQMDTLNSNLASLVALTPKVIEIVNRHASGLEDTAGLQAANETIGNVVAQLQAVVDANPTP